MESIVPSTALAPQKTATTSAVARVLQQERSAGRRIGDIKNDIWASGSIETARSVIAEEVDVRRWLESHAQGIFCNAGNTKGHFNGNAESFDSNTKKTSLQRRRML